MYLWLASFYVYNGKKKPTLNMTGSYLCLNVATVFCSLQEALFLANKQCKQLKNAACVSPFATV